MHNIIITRFGARIKRRLPNRRVLLWLCKTKLVRVVEFLWWPQSNTIHPSNGSISMILGTWLQVAPVAKTSDRGRGLRGEGSRCDSFARSLKNQCSKIVKNDKVWVIKPPSRSLLAEDSYLREKGKILICDPDESPGISLKRGKHQNSCEKPNVESRTYKQDPPTTAATWMMDGVAKFEILTKLNSATTVQKKKKKVPVIDHFRRRCLRSITSTRPLYEFVNNN